MELTVELKVEPAESFELPERSLMLEATPQSAAPAAPTAVIDLSSSGSDSDAGTLKRSRSPDDIGDVKKRKSEVKMLASLPPGFLDPLPAASGGKSIQPLPLTLPVVAGSPQRSKQFWKAGDFDGLPVVDDSVQFTLCRRSGLSKYGNEMPRLFLGEFDPCSGRLYWQ
ncbi:hypothetical protein KSP40_PGU010588 [Platanthera guangdongensis]|uniref:Uncharacterized protein n=1 Tax=Platanthera guangdongensis TaxID=2320717 RepID=A0ABR2LDJ6_9ASPA